MFSHWHYYFYTILLAFFGQIISQKNNIPLSNYFPVSYHYLYLLSPFVFTSQFTFWPCTSPFGRIIVGLRFAHLVSRGFELQSLMRPANHYVSKQWRTMWENWKDNVPEFIWVLLRSRWKNKNGSRLRRFESGREGSAWETRAGLVSQRDCLQVCDGRVLEWNLMGSLQASHPWLQYKHDSPFPCRTFLPSFLINQVELKLLCLLNAMKGRFWLCCVHWSLVYMLKLGAPQQYTTATPHSSRFLSPNIFCMIGFVKWLLATSIHYGLCPNPTLIFRESFYAFTLETTVHSLSSFSAYKYNTCTHTNYILLSLTFRRIYVYEIHVNRIV